MMFEQLCGTTATENQCIQLRTKLIQYVCKYFCSYKSLASDIRFLYYFLLLQHYNNSSYYFILKYDHIKIHLSVRICRHRYGTCTLGARERHLIGDCKCIKYNIQSSILILVNLFSYVYLNLIIIILYLYLPRTHIAYRAIEIPQKV